MKFLAAPRLIESAPLHKNAMNELFQVTSTAFTPPRAVHNLDHVFGNTVFDTLLILFGYNLHGFHVSGNRSISFKLFIKTFRRENEKRSVKAYDGGGAGLS